MFLFYTINCVPFCYIGHPRGGHIEGRSAANKHSVTLIIYGQSSAVIDHVKRALADLCATECPDVVLDTDDVQEVIVNLTQTEVIHNESLAVFILYGDFHYSMFTSWYLYICKCPDGNFILLSH